MGADESILGWIADKLLGPILGALGLLALGWVRAVARRVKSLADAMANAEAMEARLEEAKNAREVLSLQVKEEQASRAELELRIGQLERAVVVTAGGGDDG